MDLFCILYGICQRIKMKNRDRQDILQPETNVAIQQSDDVTKMADQGICMGSFVNGGGGQNS